MLELRRDGWDGVLTRPAHILPCGARHLGRGPGPHHSFCCVACTAQGLQQVTETLTAAVTGLRRRLAGIWDDSHTTLQDQCKSFLQLLKNAEAGDVTPDVAAKATVALRAFAADAVQVAANEVLLPGWCTVRIRVDLVQIPFNRPGPFRRLVLVASQCVRSSIVLVRTVGMLLTATRRRWIRAPCLPSARCWWSWGYRHARLHTAT